MEKNVIVPEKKSASIAVIAWSYILLALFVILVSGLSIFGSQYVNEQMETMPHEILESLPGMLFIMQHSGSLLILQTICAIFMLIVGIEFLRLRAWARTAIEILSWLCIVFAVMIVLFFITTWINIVSQMMAFEGNDGSSSALNVLGIGVGIILMVLFVIPLLIIIRALRGKAIRDAVSSGGF
jgi:hypothetical protein